MADAEGLIFGDTPMREALTRIKARFEREMDRIRGETLTPVLLLVSDGEATDGDPTPIAAQIHITDTDVLEPRVLVSVKPPDWPQGAIDMFGMSSVLQEDADMTRYLVREGWRVAKGAKAFVQVNHSEILEELVGMALSPSQAGGALLPKGR